MAWYWYTLTSAAALFFAFLTPLYAQIFACIGIALFAAPLDREMVPKRATIHCVVVATVSAAGSMFWFWDTLPLTWLGISHTAQAVLVVGITWVILSITFGLGFLLFRALFSIGRSGTWVDVPFFSSLWVTSEYLGMWLFALVSLGPGISLEPHFSFAFVGYLFAESPFALPIAAWGGVYALSALAACAGFICARAYTSFWYSATAAVLFVCFVWAGAPGHPASIAAHTQSLAVLHTNIPARAEVESGSLEVERLRELIEEAQQTNPDLIVVPEDIRLFQHIEKFFLNTGPIPTIGSTRTFIEPPQERLWEYTPDGAQLTRAKFLLLPYGEYVPYLGGLIVHMVVGEHAVRFVQETRAQVSADRGDTRGIFGAYTRFCSEILSPVLFVEDARRGAPFLLHLANFSWFHGSALLERRILSMARVRAVEADRWFISAGNIGASYVVDERGALVAKRSDEGILRVAIPSRASETLYQHVYVYVPYFFLVYVLVHIVIMTRMSARYTGATYGREQRSGE